MSLFTNALRFLLGILLVQAATAVQVYAVLKSGKPEIWALFAVLALTLGFLAALWFSSLVRHAQKDAVANMKEGFSREREQIRVRAEREKTKVIEKSHQQIIKDRDRTQGKANLRVGAAFAGVIGVGAIMLFTQFVTLGMLLMSTAGGALAGYAVRARQDFLGRRRDNALAPPTNVKTLAGDSARRLIGAVTGRREGPGTPSKPG